MGDHFAIYPIDKLVVLSTKDACLELCSSSNDRDIDRGTEKSHKMITPPNNKGLR